MKNILLLSSLSALLLLGACSSDEAESKEPKKENTEEATAKETSDKSSEEKDAVNVDKGLLNVELTLPESFFEGEDPNTVVENAKAQGIDEAKVNEDGSVTYKMSKAKHNELMDDMETSINESLKEMKSGTDFASVKDATANKDYTQFTLTVDQAAYENSMDGFAIFGMGMLGLYYQIFDGADAESAKVVVDVKDEATGEVFDTVTYPDDMPEQ